MLAFNEIESFEALDLELKMKKDILKNEMKKIFGQKVLFHISKLQSQLDQAVALQS
jgi:hypothetical protein